jgi:hypothetical protein
MNDEVNRIFIPLCQNEKVFGQMTTNNAHTISVDTISDRMVTDSDERDLPRSVDQYP